ncbi:response regulator [Rhodococcus sp. KRD162]|uniref:response regulator n=1 Tax=Rhodococcus sp. KRD162 TaxID=2729725 RepID=UPI0019D00A71|nr:response regulator [Rhodococcus sp. KRD162]
MRVLVVDDDFRVADLHAALVNSLEGYEVVAVATSIAQARELLATRSFDLALVDVYLPDGSGIELVRELPCEAMVLSAAADQPTVRAAMIAGAWTYLVKPFPRSALVDRLTGYVAYRAALDRSEELGQADIDSGLDALRPRPSAPTPTSQSVTRDLVLDAVRGTSEPMSAGEVAAAIGISRATAQRYLATLVSKGRLRMQLRYGSTGRPEQEYSSVPGS